MNKIIMYLCFIFILPWNLNAQLKQKILKKINTIARLVNGQVGVYALHLESKKSLGFNDNELFPMGSACKFPIALHGLAMIDEGKLTLNQLIKSSSEELSYISKKAPARKNIYVSVRHLINRMMKRSCNETSDVLLKMCGGPQAVKKRITTVWGIKDINLNRTILEMRADFNGVKKEPNMKLKDMWKHIQKVNPQTKTLAEQSFYYDWRDTATPRALVELLKKFFQGNLISENLKHYLLKTMYSCRTGVKRIPALLPPSIRVAHKTGTMDGAINDIGIIKMPDASHVILAICINKATDVSYQEREFAIARIARTLFDYFCHISKG